MTPSQIKALRRITNNVQSYYVDQLLSPPFIYRVTVHAGGGLTFSAHNQTAESHWSDTFRNVCLNIGKRGGVTWSTAENISVKLVTNS